MKKQGLTFVCLLLATLGFSFKAAADFEAIQTVITSVGDVVEGAAEQKLKYQSMVDSAEQLATQAGKYADSAKSMVNSMEDNINNITDKALGAAGGLKDMGANALNGDGEMEFAGLEETFDGEKDDDDMQNAILDNLVRKTGADSISSQKALSAAINQKNGLDTAEIYAKALVLRQQLMKEKDSDENPQSIDEAMQLVKEMQLQSMKRLNDILEMEAGIARVEHIMALENQKGERLPENENE